MCIRDSADLRYIFVRRPCAASGTRSAVRSTPTCAALLGDVYRAWLSMVSSKTGRRSASAMNCSTGAPVGDQPGGIDYTDDGWQAVLPCDHCAVGHQASHLRDQARDRHEKWRPAGVCVGRDEDVARFEIGLRHVEDDAGPPFDDPGGDR